MARLWDKKIEKTYMEKDIIEVFGCAPIHNTIIKLFTGKDKINSDIYINGNKEEASLIEIFGCISFDKVIKFDFEKEKSLEMYKRYEPVEVMVVGID